LTSVCSAAQSHAAVQACEAAQMELVRVLRLGHRREVYR
jgi:hypothetical protein